MKPPQRGIVPLVVVQLSPEGGLPRETPRLAAVLTGRRAPKHWSGEPDAFDLWDLKALLEELLARGGFGARLEGGAPDEPRLLPGAAWLVHGPAGVIGWGGQVDPTRVDAPAWAGPVFALELELPAEPDARPVARFQTLPPFPAVERDLALLVPEAVPAQRVEELLVKFYLKILKPMATRLLPMHRPWLQHLLPKILT
jgi:phenylalanyl-tRNA synthetase beta chain